MRHYFDKDVVGSNIEMNERRPDERWSYGFGQRFELTEMGGRPRVETAKGTRPQPTPPTESISDFINRTWKVEQSWRHRFCGDLAACESDLLCLAKNRQSAQWPRPPCRPESAPLPDGRAEANRSTKYGCRPQ